MWEVTKRTWAWARFTSPDKQLAFALGQHAAFWYSTAYLRLGELRLQFPGELIQYEPVAWSRWMGLWRYPNRVKRTVHDSTGLYKLELTWDAPDTATAGRVHRDVAVAPGRPRKETVWTGPATAADTFPRGARGGAGSAQHLLRRRGGGD